MPSGSPPPPPSGSRHHNNWQRGGHSRRTRGGSASADNIRPASGQSWRARSPIHHGRRYRGYRGGGGRGNYHQPRYGQSWQNRASPRSSPRDGRWGNSFKSSFPMQGGSHGRQGPSPQSQGRDTPNRRDFLPSGPGGNIGRRDGRDSRDGRDVLPLMGMNRRPYTPPGWSSGDRRGMHPPPPNISAHIHPSRQHMHAPVPQRPGGGPAHSGGGRGGGPPSFYGPHRDNRPGMHGHRAHPMLSMPLGAHMNRRNRIRSPPRSPPPMHQRRPRDVNSPRGALSGGLSRSIFGSGGDGHRGWKDGDNFPKDRGWKDNDDSAPGLSTPKPVAPVGDLRNTLSRNSAEKRRDDYRNSRRRSSSSPMRSKPMLDGSSDTKVRPISPDRGIRMNSSPVFGSKRQTDGDISNRSDGGTPGTKFDSGRCDIGARRRLRSFSPRNDTSRSTHPGSFSPQARPQNYSPCEEPQKRSTPVYDAFPVRDTKQHSPEKHTQEQQRERYNSTPPGCDAPRWDSPTENHGKSASRVESEGLHIEAATSRSRSPVRQLLQKEVPITKRYSPSREDKTAKSSVEEEKPVVGSEPEVKKEDRPTYKPEIVTHGVDSLKPPAIPDQKEKCEKEKEDDSKNPNLDQALVVPAGSDLLKESVRLTGNDTQKVAESEDAAVNNDSEKKDNSKGFVDDAIAKKEDAMEVDINKDEVARPKKTEYITPEMETVKTDDIDANSEKECENENAKVSPAEKEDAMDVVDESSNRSAEVASKKPSNISESVTGEDAGNEAKSRNVSTAESKDQSSANQPTDMEGVTSANEERDVQTMKSPESHKTINLGYPSKSLERQEHSEKNAHNKSAICDSKLDDGPERCDVNVGNINQVAEKRTELVEDCEPQRMRVQQPTECTTSKKHGEAVSGSGQHHALSVKPAANEEKIVEPRMTTENSLKSVKPSESTSSQLVECEPKAVGLNLVTEPVVSEKKETTENLVPPGDSSSNVVVTPPVSECKLPKNSVKDNEKLVESTSSPLSPSMDPCATPVSSRPIAKSPTLPAEISGPLPSFKLRSTPLPKLGSPKCKPLQLKSLGDVANLKMTESEGEKNHKEKAENLLPEISSVDSEMNALREEIEVLRARLSGRQQRPKCTKDANGDDIHPEESDAVKLSRELSEKVVEAVEQRIRNSFIIEPPMRQLNPTDDNLVRILCSNRAHARSACLALSRLCYKPGSALNESPRGAYNLDYLSNPILLKKIADSIKVKKEARRIERRHQRKEYRVLKNRWLQRQKSNRDKRPREKREQARDRDRFLLVHTRGPSAVMTCKTSSGRTSTKVLPHVTPGGILTNVAEIDSMLTEIEQYGGTPGTRDIWERTLAEIPIQDSSRVPFDSNNLLIEDPVAEWEAARWKNFWTREERLIFLVKYLVYQKNFKKISSFLENKGTNDCAQFYFNHKLEYNLKQLLRESGAMKRKGIREQHLLGLVGLEKTEQNLALCGVDVNTNNGNGSGSGNELITQGNTGTLIRSISQRKGLERDLDHAHEIERQHRSRNSRKLHQSLQFSADERQLFCIALASHGTNWKSISEHFPALARSPAVLQEYYERAKDEHDLIFYVRKHERRTNTVRMETQNIIERVRSPRVEKLTGDGAGMSARISGEIVGSPSDAPEEKKKVAWTKEERSKVEQCFRDYGKEYKVIAQKLGTKTPAQVKGYWKFLRATRDAARDARRKRQQRERGEGRERRTTSDGVRENRKRDANEAELGDEGGASSSKRDKLSNDARDSHGSGFKSLSVRKENATQTNEDDT